MRQFDGQVVPGILLGQTEPVTLPRFERVSDFRSADGQVELDAIGETASGDHWVVEAKWKSKRVGRREAEKLVRHAQMFPGQTWLISRSGFTEDALAFARTVNMYTTDGQNLRGLKNLLLKPF
jgi:hypothetical protein